MSSSTIVWFRQDLRLTDHPALQAAIRRDQAVIPLYIWDPAGEGDWPPGGAARYWLHQALKQLDADLQDCGSRLILRQGNSLDVLLDLTRSDNVDTIYWNRRYEPASIERDTEVKKALNEEGLKVASFNGSLLIEPWEIETKSGGPYKVFTPYYRRCLEQAEDRELFSAPKQLHRPRSWPDRESLEALGLEPEVDWADGIHDAWDIGEAGGHRQLDRFLEDGLGDYEEGRDRPDREFVSRLSPYLHFGHLSPNQVRRAVEEAGHEDDQPGRIQQGEAYIRELYWREFSYHLLFHFPQVPDQPLREEFSDFRWSQSRKNFEAWQQGQTGYPIVDAGMRQLWKTGWMHNRVRMIVASFLTKDLLIHWREGAQWFWDTLVDADLANNTQGWQWTAGCGADAAPYFRIFNPVTQGERYDPEGDYIRRYVPELAGLTGKNIHSPWTASQDELKRAGIELGETYPKPIVDHKEARKEALDRYQDLKD